MAYDDLFDGGFGPADEDQTAVHEVSPLGPDGSLERSAALLCISGRSIGHAFVLKKDETTLGRAPECDVFLDDEGVSRYHAKVVRREGKLVLLDLESTNGTWHDGERIQVVTLEDAVKIQLGTATILQFRYQDDQELEFHTMMQNFKTHDHLTEAFNRRAFMSEIDKEASYARRQNQPLSLIMFDLDEFKQVNDSHGHSAGDQVIRTVAQAVMETKRKEDIFSRYGGEEFALLLRACSQERAFIVAERIRRAVEKLEIVHKGHRIKCTVSLGVATLDPNQQNPSSELIEWADDRLYQAKRKGRNRTETPLFD